MSRGRGVPPKPAGYCRLVIDKPYLDGHLCDSLWQRAKKLVLTSQLHDDANWPCTILLAYDRDFLYLGISCKLALQATYTTDDSPRPRDGDVSENDRLEFFLDVDRDYASFYHLTVDYRGWTRDVCFGDRLWNPSWYVAAARDTQIWSAEAAIPLAELSDEPPQGGDVWALGIQRTIPTVGFQAWSWPASVEVVPEGFGLLFFE